MVKKIGRNTSSSPKKGKRIGRDGSELKSAKKISRSAESTPTPLRTVFSTATTSFFPGGVPFSEFDARGNVRVDDIIVGLRNNENSQFFLGAGLLDANDNFIIGYSSVGANAVNYINFDNAVSGDAPVIVPLGQDGNIPLTIRSKNDAPVNIYTNDNYFNLNDTNPIYGVTIDGTLTGATDLYVPSALAVKTYVDNTFALVDPTYVTNTDERYRLPNSQPLSILSTGFTTVTTATGIMGTRIHTGTTNQITVTNGSGAAGNPTYSLPSTLIAPGSLRTTSTLQVGSSGAIVTSISTDGTLASNLDTLLSSQKAIKTYVDTSDTAIKAATYVTNTNQTALLPNSQSLSALATGIVGVTTATGLLTSYTLMGTANQVTVTNGTGGANPTFSLPSTLIAPGTFQATTSINIGGSGATITSISTDGTLAANSDALTVTQKAVKTYADTADTAIKSYSYITKTDNTANLPNSVPLSGIATGFLANTTATGVLTARTMTGTANQVTVTNGDGSGVPTFSLPITLITPGTLQVGSTLNVGGAGATVTSISIDGTMAANSDTLVSTQKAVKTYADAVGGASVTLTNAGIAGGTTSLVNDGTGPALAVKGLVGSTNILVTTNTTDTTISLTGTIAVTNALTMNNGGAGAASGTTFDGSVARTISYNTVGASPLAGSSSLTTTGTVTSGTWSATAIGEIYGGTGQTTYAVGDLLYASTSSALSKLNVGTNGYVLTLAAGLPTWAAATGGGSGAKGYIWMNTGNWTGQTFSFTSSYQELTSIGTNFTLASGATDFAMTTDGRLKYTGATTINVVLNAYYSVANGSGTYAMELYKNGSALTGSEIYVPNNGHPTISGFTVNSVATNDYFSIWVKRSASQSNAIYSAFLSAEAV